jgi:hypothetical protein
VTGNISIAQAPNSAFPPFGHIPTPATGNYSAGSGTASGTYTDSLSIVIGSWSGTKYP